MITVKSPIVVMSAFLWIGFICAISFMEAWLKFTAPGVTISVGLNIGRVVFTALNKAEWIFAIAIMIGSLPLKRDFFAVPKLLYLIPLLLLFTQTVWLLPRLDARAEMYIAEKAMAPSNLHFYYIIMEVTKVICLSIFGLSLFKDAAKVSH